MNYFDYGEQDFVPCELCGNKCVDVHHLDGRGKGKDIIGNLIGLCRDCHIKCHSSKEFNKKAKESHEYNLR